MRLSDHARKDVATVPHTASVAEVARKLHKAGVGCLVVVGDDGRAVGVVTDRDLTVKVVAQEDVGCGTRISEVMSSPTVSVDVEADVFDVLARMRHNGVRRIPVLADGRPVGLVSIKDLVDEIAHELIDLVGADTN
jgi:signal-transduction protein with cAMP-binding, CBS, and nucleotidyltransferase domain